MSAWLCSPCALEGKLAVTAGAAGAAGAGGSAVCIRLSRCAAAALGELTALLLASPAAWVDQLLSALALILVGRGRDAPLAAAALQRTVLLAHLFGSCCRARREAARLRVAAFELARHRSSAEPALLAALCCAWPEPLHLEAPPAAGGGGGASLGLGHVLGVLACRGEGRPLDLVRVRVRVS